MQGKRGGRVQVNVLQFMELVERVEALEAIANKTESPETDNPEMTKAEVMEALDKLTIKYNPRDKKEVLNSLLESHSED